RRAIARPGFLPGGGSRHGRLHKCTCRGSIHRRRARTTYMNLPSTRNRRALARAAVGIGTAAGLAVSTLAAMPSASAAIPTFPNNVIVFPDRDFVSVEGYQDHAGETATVTVTPGT